MDRERMGWEAKGLWYWTLDGSVVRFGLTIAVTAAVASVDITKTTHAAGVITTLV